MALRANIWNENGKFCLQTGYNWRLVQCINELPDTDAQYRDETRTWYIDPKHEQSVRTWLRMLGYLVTSVDLAIPTSSDDSFSVLGLLPTADWVVCDAAYKALSKVHHPDLGGNTETMQQINEAWVKVKLAKGK